MFNFFRNFEVMHNTLPGKIIIWATAVSATGGAVFTLAMAIFLGKAYLNDAKDASLKSELPPLEEE